MDVSKRIDSIESVRKVNNNNWMDVLRLAVKYAPRNEVVDLLRRINACDAAINRRFTDMIKSLEEEKDDKV